MNTKYTSQDRGDQQNYQQYLEAMDAISIEKVASASTFFEPEKGNVIVDVGMASGTSSAILAQLFPDLEIIGVDINPKMVEIAQDRYHYPNLSFRTDDGEKLSSFKENTINGFFNCSAIHHITSYNGYDSNRAIKTLERQVQLLKERGVLVVRDFIKPEEKEVVLELSTLDKTDRLNDCELLLQFSQQARSLAPDTEKGFPIKEIKSLVTNTRRFQLFLTDATEFIRRKDYFENWDIELQEEYGYFTQKEFEESFRNLGLRIVLSAPIYNQWIINNRYHGQIRLFNLDGKEIGFPPTNYIIAGEKMKAGKQIRLIRHLQQPEKPFLRYSSHLNRETQQIFDVVERPNNVIDILPFYQEGSRITILAKHGYPRPLVNVQTDSPLLDNKKYSGYITEGITIAETQDLQTTLSERFRIDSDQYIAMEHSLDYYTSPGGIDERVSAYFLRLNESPLQTIYLKEGFSGFKESGFIHPYDASQLLSTAQTGALAEARLELNIYHLFYKNNLPLPNWLGEKISIHDSLVNAPVSLASLLKNKKKVYQPTDKQSGFLRTQRGYFTEMGALQSNAVLEYVYPEQVSSNTLLTLPVCRMNGEIYVGLEVRDLPVPQLFTGNSIILTVPAKRLPKDVSDLFELNNYLTNMKIGEAEINAYFKLGEKYYPSIGITTEQVYPYVVCLEKATDELAWVSFSELCENFTMLEDAHLMIGLARLRHAITY